MAEKWHPDFERLVDEHQSMVFSLAWRMTGDRGLAEEVAQDVFLELDRHMERIESPEHAMFWLRRVAMSRSADALRRRKVRGVDLWVEIEENHGAPAEERASPLSAAPGAIAFNSARGAAGSAGAAVPGRFVAGRDCGHGGRAGGDGEEQFAAGIEAVAVKGNNAVEGVHSWTLSGLDQPEQIDEFERELQQAMERRPAPPSLKRRIHAAAEHAAHGSRAELHGLVAAAGGISVAGGVIAGGYSWRQAEDRRKGEEAAQQVLTALRITNRALNDMNRRLAARNRADQ